MIGVLTLALLGASPATNYNPADLADTRCFLVVSAAAKSQSDPIAAARMQMGASYFIGKIIGRNPTADLEALVRAVLPLSAAQTTSEAARCGAELVKLGTSMQAIGKALTADGL